MEQRTEPQWLEEGDKEEFGGQRGGWGTKGRSSKQRTTEPTTNVEEGRRTMIAVALAMTMEKNEMVARRGPSAVVHLSSMAVTAKRRRTRTWWTAVAPVGLPSCGYYIVGKRLFMKKRNNGTTTTYLLGKTAIARRGSEYCCCCLLVVPHNMMLPHHRQVEDIIWNTIIMLLLDNNKYL